MSSIGILERPKWSGEGNMPKGIKRKADRLIKNAMPNAYHAAGDSWRDECLHMHMERGAASRYKYATRNLKYLKSKRGQPPLVLSGKMRDALLSRRDIRANSKGVRVMLDASGTGHPPGFLHFRGRYGTGPDKAKELTAVIPEELSALQQVVADYAQKALNKAIGG